MSEQPSTEPELPDQPSRDQPSTEASPDPLRGSIASRTWLGLGALASLLVVTVVFVAQNTATVPLKLLGWTWHPPLAAALLAAVALGLSLALVAGSLRILQLRRRVRRTKK